MVLWLQKVQHFLHPQCGTNIGMIYSFFNKNRIFLRLTDFIGGNAYTFRPYFCLAHLLSLRLIPLTVLPYPIYFSFSQKALHAFAVSFIFPAVAFSFQIRYNFSNCNTYGGISFEILRKVYFRKIRLLYLYAKPHRKGNVLLSTLCRALFL